jgi:hypothetical protein
MVKILIKPGFPKVRIIKKIPNIIQKIQKNKKIRFYTRHKREHYDYFKEWYRHSRIGSITHYIYQTYQEFKDRIELIHEIPKDGIVFFSRAEATKFPPEVTTVSIRIDKGSMLATNFELVNRKEDENQRCIFVLPWPLMTIKPRESNDKIQRIGYLGGSENIHKYFRTSEWQNEIHNLGLEWFTGHGKAQDDYTNIDVLIAFRDKRHDKPPTKLINAWHGEVIPILGNDPGGESLGTDGKNCIIAKEPQEVISILRDLITNQDLREELFRGAKEGKKLYSKTAIRNRWEYIFSKIISMT